MTGNPEAGRSALEQATRRRFRHWLRGLALRPRHGAVKFGDLRRLRPISDDWGFDRGEPVDRFFIRNFMDCNAADVRGHVLEIGTNEMTLQYGRDKVTKSDVLHVVERRKPVTIVGNLVSGEGVPPETFDCVILTQTLQFIFDVRAAVHNLHRSLKPGGVALVTVPAITRISHEDMERWGQFWSFTTRSAYDLFRTRFSASNLQVEAYGNVFAAVSFLHGVSADELTEDELLHRDPGFETLVTIRAVRSS